MTAVLPFRVSKTCRRDALESLSHLLAEDMAAVNALVLERMKSGVPMIGELARHIVAAGGKRVRPLLALASARLSGATGARPHKLAASVELIHTATLLHDDVVDESGLRRGRPSANALFGNQASVLVGDFLLSRAFEMMVEDGDLEVLRILSAASSVISQGEVMQLAAQGDAGTSEDAYLDIVRAKTAELFSAACRIGAVVADCARPHEEALRSFGLNFGIAFQIADDVLDYAAREETVGKSVGNDFREGKVTLPLILAYHRGDEAERAFWEKILNKNIQEGDFIRAQGYMRARRALEDSMERALHYAAIAKDALGLFEKSPFKTALDEMAYYAVSRAF